MILTSHISQWEVDFPTWEVVFNIFLGGTVIWSPFCIFKIIILVNVTVYWTSQKNNRFSIFFGLGSVCHKVMIEHFLSIIPPIAQSTILPISSSLGHSIPLPKPFRLLSKRYSRPLERLPNTLFDKIGLKLNQKT